MELNPNLKFLIWCVVPLTKAIYWYIGLTSEGPTEVSAPTLALALGALGSLAAFGGVFVTRSAEEGAAWVAKLFGTAEGKYAAWVVGLGLIETPALFGMVGYLQSGNEVLFAALTLLSLLGWLMAKSQRRKSQP